MIISIGAQVEGIKHLFNRTVFMTFIKLPSPDYVSVYFSDCREVIQ